MAICSPSWGHLGPSWAQLGTSKPILKPTWHPSCCLQAFKPTRRPPSNHFASFLKACCIQKSAKNTDCPYVFCCFCNLSFGLLSTPETSLQSPKSASRCPPGPPKRGQGGPKIAQDGPKMGPKRGAAQRQNPASYFLEPSWSPLGAILGQLGLNLAFSNPS